MQTVAFLTTLSRAGGPIYDHLTVEPLSARKIAVESVDWRADEDWGRFAAVLPRSTWDYHLHCGEFFAALERVRDSGARLYNDLEVMRWNADKHYLGELADRGVPVVQSRYGTELNTEVLAALRDELGSRDLVLKPVVSASAEGTFRLRHGEDAAPAITHLHGQAWIAQPFMEGILSEGEYSLIFLDGEFSHALLKQARSGDFRVQEEHGGTIRPVRPTGPLLDAARAVLDTLPSDLLYARLDFVGAHSGFLLMEAELIEPSLYFSIDVAGPVRFADALARRIHAGPVA